MAASDKDLDYVVSVTADVDPARKAIETLEKDLQSKSNSRKGSGGGPAAPPTMPASAPTPKIDPAAAKSADPSARSAKESKQKLSDTQDLTDEIEKQKKLLLDIKEATDPKYVKERVRLEQERADVLKKVSDAEEKRQRLLERERLKREKPADRKRREDESRQRKEREIAGWVSDPYGAALDAFGRASRPGTKSSKSERREKESGGLPQIGPGPSPTSGPSSSPPSPSGRGPGVQAGAGNDLASLFGGKGKLGELFGGGKTGGGEMLGGAGKMLGTMLGGPIGGAVGEAVGKELPKVLAAPAKLAVGALKTVADSLDGLGGKLGPVGMGFDLLSAGAEGFAGVVKSVPVVGELLGPLVDTLAAIPGIFKQMVSTLTDFGAVASPAAMKRLQIATQDVMGVIGQAFVPVMDLMRYGIRAFGDVLANILPSTEEMRWALSGVSKTMADVGADVRNLVAEFGPMIKEGIMIYIQHLGNMFSIAARHAANLAKTLGYVVRPMKDLLTTLGVIPSGPGGDKSSVGAAARTASISGFDEYQKQLQLTAYTEPGTIGQNDVPKAVNDIRLNVEKVAGYLSLLTPQGIGAAVSNAVFGRGGAAPDKPKDVSQAVQEAMWNPVRAARRGMGW